MAANELQRKSDSYIPRCRNVFLKAFREGRKKVSAKRIKSALDSKNSYLAELEAVSGVNKVEEMLRESLPELIKAVLVAAGNIAGSELPTPPEGVGPSVMGSRPIQSPVRFNKTNPDAVAWAQNYASDLIRDVTAESRDAINRVIAARLASGASTTETAKIIQMSVGLTEPFSAAVANLNERLVASSGQTVKAGALRFRVPVTGMTRTQLDAALTRYADRLTKIRARNIARTATRTASNEGQRQMWRQARNKGLLSGAERRQWIASRGACTICAALDGETATLEGTFPGGIAHPPAHGSCECTQSLTYG